jgi:hypothetical protein
LKFIAKYRAKAKANPELVLPKTKALKKDKKPGFKYIENNLVTIPEESKSMKLESIEIDESYYEEVEELPNITDMQVLVIEMYFKLGEVEATLTNGAINRRR